MCLGKTLFDNLIVYMKSKQGTGVDCDHDQTSFVTFCISISYGLGLEDCAKDLFLQMGLTSRLNIKADFFVCFHLCSLEFVFNLTLESLSL